MATYTDTVYANSITGENYASSGGVVTLHDRTRYEWTGQEWQRTFNRSTITLGFPASTKYPKKRPWRAEEFIHILSATQSQNISGWRIEFELLFGGDSIRSVTPGSYVSTARSIYAQPLLIDAGLRVASFTGASTLTSFTVNGVWTMYGIGGRFPPYQVITYEDVVPFVTSISPSSGFLNEQVANTFKWGMGYDGHNVLESLTLKSSIFQWRVTDSSAINEIRVDGSTGRLTIPANTFPRGSFQFRIQVTSDDNVASGFTDWMTISTIDQRHRAPLNLRPSGGTIDGSQPNSFSWTVNSPYGTPQSAFEVQISYDGGVTYSRLSGKIYSTSPSYTTPANSILSGLIAWRVRTYNKDDVEGPWGSAFVRSRAAPLPPVWISGESDNPRPLCRWNVVEQVAYELSILQGDEQMYFHHQFGGETEHRVREFLENGQYVFRLRVQNNTELWSDWADYPVTLFHTPNLDIRLTGEDGEYSVTLNFSAEVRQ